MNALRNFIDDVNGAVIDDAVLLLTPVLERSPWLARQVADDRPFEGLEVLVARIETRIRALSDDDKMRLLRAHPELAPAFPAQMTQASQDEQARLAIGRPSGEIARRLRDLNARYRKRHGFPFIIALHAVADLEAVLDCFAASIERDTDTEISRALGEIVLVAQDRLAQLVARPVAAPSAPLPAEKP